jgi:hypothetical protein
VEDLCGQCNHANGPHLINGGLTSPEHTHGVAVPVAGWRTCPEEGCECWGTWAIAHPDLPAELVATIEQYLDGLRTGRRLFLER